MSQAACGLAAGHFLDLNLSFAKVFFQTLEGMAELLDTVSLFRVWWAVPLWACRLQSDSG